MSNYCLKCKTNHVIHFLIEVSLYNNRHKTSDTFMLAKLGIQSLMYTMIRFVYFMMQRFLIGVVLNMLLILILILKSITSCNLSNLPSIFKGKYFATYFEKQQLNHL